MLNQIAIGYGEMRVIRKVLRSLCLKFYLTSSPLVMIIK